jgi:hypothetical protein
MGGTGSQASSTAPANALGRRERLQLLLQVQQLIGKVLDRPDARNINIDSRSLQNQPDKERVMHEYGKASAAAHHAQTECWALRSSCFR